MTASEQIATAPETFEQKTLDGYTICLRWHGDVIAFGSRFDEYARRCLHGLNASNRQDAVKECFDWFKNYAPLLKMDEQKRGYVAYRRALSVYSDVTASAFWSFFDGKSLHSLGKGVFEYREGAA